MTITCDIFKTLFDWNVPYILELSSIYPDLLSTSIPEKRGFFADVRLIRTLRLGHFSSR